MAEGRVAPEDRRSEIGDGVGTTNDTKLHEREKQGVAQGTCAGASESDSLASELADAPVSESLTRSASIPAFSLDPFLATLSNI